MRTIPKIAEDIRTQDNRITSNPIFTVQEKRGRSWGFVTACFTEKGCEDYIAANGHNLTKPRIYVESGYRNKEWETLRQHLMAIKQEPTDT